MEKLENDYLEKYNNLSFKVPRTIAVLLDLEGTSDFIDDEKAKLFIEQLDIIRKKFGAELGTISISTHFRDLSRMENVLEILSHNTTSNIKIGLNFYYGGIYDFNKRLNIPQGYNFNSNKISTFDNYYVHNSEMDNQWFALIDDTISEETYKKYQNNHPMLLSRPSQLEYGLKYNCFMNISTMTKGFDGVLEAFDKYINSIKELSPEQILEIQRNMLVHLSGYELTDKIRKRDYSFIERYFVGGYADETDYRDALKWIIFTNSNQTPTKEELIQIKNILELMTQKFQVNNDEQNIERVKKLQRDFGQSS